MLGNLPDILDDLTVRYLREMEKEQSEEWKSIFEKMSFNHRMQFSKIKAKQQRAEKQEKKEHWSFQDWVQHELTMNSFIAARLDYPIQEEEIAKLLSQRLTDIQEERFIFFWETSSPFSQWHPSEFLAPSYLWKNEFWEQLVKEGFPEEYMFSSAEQFMMYCKAMLFLDIKIAKQIMTVHSPREIKNLGRQVRGFSEDTWYVYRWRIVYLGNKYKFSQNKALKEALLSTKGTTLVEASPYDKIWGIGLSKDDPAAQQRATWEGKNLLGEILTQLRIEFSGSY